MTTAPHPSHSFLSDSHHRCEHCTRTRVMAAAPCDRHPEVLASRVRMFGLMVERVYGRRRMKRATAEELATAFARWGRVAPVNWPGYHGHRIAAHDSSWCEFLGRDLPDSMLVLGPAGARVA